MSNINIAVIGGGYWGKNLIRNFNELQSLHTICDPCSAVLEKMSVAYPGVKLTEDFQDVLLDREVHAVVISSPAVLHYSLTKQAILAGKDVFVEKPLALNSDEGDELVKLAEEHKRVLMVGHLLQYHPAIHRLKKLINEGSLGKIQYIYSNRLNFGKIRKEENILWSFAPHDISVILSLINEMPVSASCTGANYLSPQIDDTTMSNLYFNNGVRAHIFVSWLHPFKEQKLVVIGDKQMAVFDDTLPWDKKLVLYPHKVVWINQAPQAEKAECEFVTLEQVEPLQEECRHFIDCVKHKKTPITDAKEGARVLKVLNAFQESLDNAGLKVDMNKKATNSNIHSTACVHPSSVVGSKTKIWHFTHVMPNTTIGHSCSFGQNCVVGPNVTVGDRVKVQNNISIYDGVEIEDDVFLGPSMVFTNVINPRSFVVRKEEFKKTVLKKGCSIGANATIVCGITIGEYAFVGAGSVVTRDVAPYSLVYGSPAKHRGWVSQRGNKLEFDENGYAIDAEDNSDYQLENGLVVAMEEENETVF